MAATPAAIQAVLDSTGKGPTLLSFNNTDGTTYTDFYVHGGIPYGGRDLWCRTTNSGDATAQAGEITTQLGTYR